MERKSIASTWRTPFLGDNPFYYNYYNDNYNFDKGCTTGEWQNYDEPLASLEAEASNGVAPNGVSDILYTGYNLEDIPANSTIHNIYANFTLHCNNQSPDYCDSDYYIGFYSGTKCCVQYHIRNDLGAYYKYATRTVNLTEHVTAADLADFGVRLSVRILRGASSFSYSFGGCTLYIDYTPGTAEKTGDIILERKQVKINLGEQEVKSIYTGGMKLY